MSALYALPDLPDEPDEPDLPDLPEQPAAPESPELPEGWATFPAPAPLLLPAGAPAIQDDDLDAGEQHPLDTGELEEAPADAGEWEGEDQEQPGGGFPDLRPYADLRAAARLVRDYGPDGARLLWRGAKAAGRGTGTALGATGRWIGRTLRSAIDHVATALAPVWVPLCNWCAEAPGPRLGGTALAVFVAGHPLHAPMAVRIGAALGWVVAVGATLAHSRTGEGDEAAKKPAKATKKKKGKEAPAKVSKEAGPPPTELPADLPAEDVVETPGEGAEDAPEGAPQETPVEASEEAPGEPVEGLAEAPPAPPAAPPALPSREAIAEAFHHLYAGGSGVLLTTLRNHLGVADPRTLKEALAEAGIRWRDGVRCTAGNSAGIHCDDAPPLPSLQEDPQEVEKAQVSGTNNGPNNNPNNTGETSEERFVADPTEWTAEELARGFRVVPNPKGGPAAWTVEQREDT
ncbi:hypothetical protein ACFY0G_17530 [Streptomyces sp. NPDC001552]|uniref:hypothetical protein n=1 Tax=Streptomyces sp. NPDC001552 TaxID=3364587 RepID=UPI0036BB7848